jgi:hypothetical protein
MFTTARGFSSDDLVMYTNMAVKAYNKYDKLNDTPK